MADTMPRLATPPPGSSAGAQRWARRRDIVIATLGWIFIVGLAIWAAAHVIRALLILVVAGLLAYALMPAVKFLTRYVPRWMAILLAYLAVVSVLGALGYLIVSSAVEQVTSLATNAGKLLTPTAAGADPPLVQRLEHLGIPRAWIQSAGGQILAQTQTIATDVVPLLEGVFNTMLDFILVVVLSIYMLIDGQRAALWLRTSAPIKVRPRVTFMTVTLQRVVGGYIRGQLILSTLVGLLVGLGMALFRLPYAVLLGVLAFILEFIPIIGVFVSGAACVLIALTQGWLLALVVLAYFVFVHIIEGDIVGPRVVGRAVGVHPVVSMVALLAGADLFGIWGALFAAPLAGLVQAVLAEAWREWRQTHANQFPEQFGAAVVPVTTAQAIMATPSDEPAQPVTTTPSPPVSPTAATPPALAVSPLTPQRKESRRRARRHTRNKRDIREEGADPRQPALT
jgi:predicted PurR-regulated permease PerM